MTMDYLRWIGKQIFGLLSDNNGNLSHIRCINVSWATMAIVLIPYAVVKQLHIQPEIVTLIGCCIGVFGVLASANKYIEMKRFSAGEHDPEDEPPDAPPTNPSGGD